MKKLLFLIASSMPIGIAAMALVPSDYQRATIQENKLYKLVLNNSNTSNPISALTNISLTSFIGYYEKLNALESDILYSIDSASEEDVYDIVGNTHGIYRIKIKEAKELSKECSFCLEKTGFTDSFTIPAPDGIVISRILQSFQVKNKIYCYFLSDLEIKCTSFACKKSDNDLLVAENTRAELEKLEILNDTLIPESLLPPNHQSTGKGQQIPKRIISVGKKIYFLANSNNSTNIFFDATEHQIIESPNIALSMDNALIAYLKTKTMVVISNGQTEQKILLYHSWKNKLQGLIAFCKSFYERPLNQTAQKQYCYFDKDGVLHVALTPDGKEFVIAPQKIAPPKTRSWPSWFNWRYTAPATFLGIAAMLKIAYWKAFSPR